MISIETNTIGEAWEKVVKSIRENGSLMKDEDQELLELCHVWIHIIHPSANDPMISKMDPIMEKWMRDNFTLIKKVPELKNSWSYGWRLYKYQDKIDQIAWVIDVLKKKPESKSATITMLQGAGIEPYVPCVSLIDFKIRNKTLWITATCRSLDFGKKAIFNMVNLVNIGQEIAAKLSIKNIELFLNVISAHIYKQDLTGK
jgi:thymidylate synthase